MELNRDCWSARDGADFHLYLESLAVPEKADRQRSILNTKLPLLAISTPILRDIAKQIAKGNYVSFLDLGLNTYFEDSVIRGALIAKIKDFETMKTYLLPFAEQAESWATCDLFPTCANAHNADNWWQLSGEMLSSEKCFVRRIGIIIMFKFILPIGGKDHLNQLFDRISALGKEKEYYVNMAAAWLVAECFIKRREETLEFYKQNTMNAFIVNKSIQKCRDSYRITNEDKQLLLRFKAKCDTIK